MNEYPSSSIPAHKKIFSPIEEEAGDNSGARNDEKKGNVSRFTITGGGAREEEGDERGGDVTHKPSDQSGVIIDGNSPIKDKNFRRGQSMGSLDEHIHLASSKAGTETYRDEKQQMPYRQQPVSFQSPAPRVGQGGSGFNPSVPAFKPSAPEFQPVEVTHDNAPGRPRHSGPPVSMGTLGMGGKSRLPVFSQLQAVDSGSDRGSSRRSDRSSPTNSIDSMTNSIDSMHTDGKVAPRMLIRELTQKMGSKDESKAAAAAKKVFDIVRESCPSWRQNQTEICRSPEMLMTLAALLRAGSERCRYEACRALGNVAFQNPGALGQALPAGTLSSSGAADAEETDICNIIVSSVGMLDGLKYVLREGTDNSKHEAARVINNCAAYSAAAAELIASSNGMLDALKALCGQASRAQRTRAKAVGALNCLSTYERVRPILLQHKVVEDALLPALASRKNLFGDGEEFKAMRADAVMASANLVGKQEFSVLISEPDAFKTVMKCLLHGVEGRVWAGVTWTAYSALLPLSNLTVSDTNKHILYELGLVGLLFTVLNVCISKVEIELALECLDNLVFSEECRKEYLRHNFMALLHKSVRMYGMGEKGTILLRRTQRIIWLVTRQGDSPELRKLQHQHAHPVHGRHIFISFGADAEDEDDYPEHVKLLKEALTGAGFRVYCKPAGGDPEEMAEAVSTCSIFMPCATRRYKERAECQFEACYAQDARRPFLPLAMEGEFDRSWGWMHTLTAGKNTVDFSGACQDGSHPAVMLIVNIVMQWIGTPPLTTPPRLATPRQSSPRSTQSVSSPLVLPQQPSAGIVSNQAKMNSPQIPSQTQSSIQHSPQIRDQALPQQQQQKHSSPKALQHSKLPHQQMQNSQTQNAHDTAPGAWA